MHGIFHVGVTVSDLEKSIIFYRDVLGLSLIEGPSKPKGGEVLAKGVGVPEAVSRLALLEAGEGHILELIEYVAPPSPLEKPAPPNALGAMHIAFKVKDIDDKVKALTTKGVSFLTKPNESKKGISKGWKWVYFKDPDGITLELVEPPENNF